MSSSYDDVVLGRATDGTWTRRWSGSLASGYTSGALSTAKVRSSTSWFSAGATAEPRLRQMRKLKEQGLRQSCCVQRRVISQQTGHRMEKAPCGSHDALSSRALCGG